MEQEQVVSILETLAAGGSLETPDAIQALGTAATLLKAKVRLAAAGRTWRADEEEQLLREFDGGMAIEEIARAHARSKGAITSRLAKLGRIDPASIPLRYRPV